MTKNRYRISKQAIQDLNEIWFYTYRNWSKDRADKYYQLILREIEFVVGHFSTAQSAEHLRKDYRKSRIKSHLIFFRKKEKDLIEVVRIVHHRMDIKKHL